MGFVPNMRFRNKQDYFRDFFPNVGEFIEFLKYRILDDRPITQNGSLKYNDIDNQFLANIYYAFNKEYRNRIVLEQEFFYDDMTMKMFDKRYQLGLLYQLWLEKNDVDPFDNMNDNFYETYRHSRTEDTGEKNVSVDNRNATNLGKDNTTGVTDTESNNVSSTNSKSSDETKSTDLSKSNTGSIQGPLALSDMDLVSDEASDEVLSSATEASVEKSKTGTDSISDSNTDNKSDSSSTSSTNRETVNKSLAVDKSDHKRDIHSDISTLDEHKRNKINKVELINTFRSTDVQSGIQSFVTWFADLFSSMNGGEFRYNSYWETDYDDLDIPEVPLEPKDLSSIVKVKNIGYIPPAKISERTVVNSTIALNPGLTKDDFYVSNIFADKGKANLIGDLEYEGMVTVYFVTNPEFTL